MKIRNVKQLTIPDVKVIRFGRFCDHRGYFTEQFRESDLLGGSECDFLRDVLFVQANESYSNRGTIRGLHFQWNPYMGKLVRTLTGHMIDMVLDIRKGSPYFGKIIAYSMPADHDRDYDEWIWVPPGFAHGNFFPEATLIEYFCSGEYSPKCEAGISPLARDLDWSLCEPALKSMFERVVCRTMRISDKDKNAHSFKSWCECSDSEQFVYGNT